MNGGDLRRASQRNDREMSPAVMKVDFECEAIAGSSCNEGARFGAGRPARPAFAWLDAGLSIGWSEPEVDFVGRLAIERGVRSMLVIPGEERGDSSGETHSAQGNPDPATPSSFGSG